MLRHGATNGCEDQAFSPNPIGARWRRLSADDFWRGKYSPAGADVLVQSLENSIRRGLAGDARRTLRSLSPLLQAKPKQKFMALVPAKFLRAESEAAPLCGPQLGALVSDE